ncbi:Hypothetical predicted protein [Octopus vulgaris]|uniref:Secreted protein n=1 Tax=Octopus vulgaris TaxID=6645 RepID=A0AA36F4B2_OCTVU|nr:Hypothetical predicted protein [Octopus vulgaris]
MHTPTRAQVCICMYLYYLCNAACPPVTDYMQSQTVSVGPQQNDSKHHTALVCLVCRNPAKAGSRAWHSPLAHQLLLSCPTHASMERKQTLNGEDVHAHGSFINVL